MSLVNGLIPFLLALKRSFIVISAGRRSLNSVRALGFVWIGQSFVFSFSLNFFAAFCFFLTRWCHCWIAFQECDYRMLSITVPTASVSTVNAQPATKREWTNQMVSQHALMPSAPNACLFFFPLSFCSADFHDHRSHVLSEAPLSSVPDTGEPPHCCMCGIAPKRMIYRCLECPPHAHRILYCQSCFHLRQVVLEHLMKKGAATPKAGSAAAVDSNVKAPERASEAEIPRSRTRVTFSASPLPPSLPPVARRGSAPAATAVPAASLSLLRSLHLLFFHQLLFLLLGRQELVKFTALVAGQ